MGIVQYNTTDDTKTAEAARTRSCELDAGDNRARPRCINIYTSVIYFESDVASEISGNSGNLI